MATHRIYKPVDEWAIVENSEAQDEHGRPYVKIAIAEIHGKDGAIKYVTEAIYQNILNGLQENKGLYKIATNFGRTPQMYITMDGMLVIHNEQMMGIVRTVKDAMSKLPADMVCDALREANFESAENGLHMQAIAASVNAATGIRAPLGFIAAVLNNYFADALTANDDIAGVTSSLSAEELRNYSMECLRYRLTGSFFNPETQEDLESFGTDPDSFITALQSEIFMRFITRRIKSAR